jgi:hypothetical protein
LGTVQTTGDIRTVNSYRSELQGIHTILLGIAAVCNFYHITEGMVTIGCDNLAGVNRSTGDWLKVNQSTKHVDLIRAIRRLKDSMSVKICFVHVDGHQDNTTAIQDLPRLAQLNVEMDLQAKARLRSLIAASASPLPKAPIYYEGWRCVVDGIKITSDPAAIVRNSIFGKQLQASLQERDLLSSDAFQDIDWDAIDSALAQCPPLYRLWVTKHVSGFFANGKMMKHWGFWDNQRCPCCHHIKEDKEHLLICPAPSCVEKWAASVQGLQEWLQEVDTAPALMHCISHALAARKLNQSFQAVCSGVAHPAAVAQDRIGWVHFTEGKISKHWKAIQSDYYHTLESPRSAHQWASGLVANLLAMTHSQWTHRNNILHACDTQGIRLRQTQELDSNIRQQFHLGSAGLLARDFHLIERGLDSVLHMATSGKMSWLSSIRVARENFGAHVALEVEGMRITNYFQPV